MLQANFLGQFEINLDGQRVIITSRTAQNILAYLILHPNISHRREKLAGQYWPESSDSIARTNLRHSLWLIRKALGDKASLLIQSNDQVVTYLPQPGDQLDVDSFEQIPEIEASIKELLNAVSHYKGELLPGFYDDWILLEREHFQASFDRKMEYLLDRLLVEKRWNEVLIWGEHWILSGHSPEPAFRALMLAYAGIGNLTGAAAQYQRCVNSLASELDVEPSEKTRQAFEQIRQGNLDAALSLATTPSLSVNLPTFPEYLKETEKPPAIFVGRETEISMLNGYLQKMLQGQLQIVFITGEAGSGKSALLHEFINRSITAQPDLGIGLGSCNAFFGQGVPYLPFRDVMTMLAGDLEAIYTDGTITRNQAKRLIQFSPLVLQALADNGLVIQNNLLNSSKPAARHSEISSSKQLQEQESGIKNDQPLSSTRNEESPQFFEQYVQVLRKASLEHPLLIVLDDLQWMDPGTGRLLFHLVNRLSNSRILIAGAYRSEDISLQRNGERHPLEPLINQFQSSFGKITINLDQLNEKFGRIFIDAFLDTEENHLDEAFRAELYQRTQGHPFFTIQMLRNFQERREIFRDKQGYWTALSEIEWKSLSPQVEGVIAERIGRLTPELQDLLMAASVEGEQFTVQVLEQVHGRTTQHILRLLTRDLEKRQRLVQEVGETRVGGQQLIHFRFVHALIQQYLYNQLSASERSSLHHEIAVKLENLYKEDLSPVVGPLARHFCEAEIKDKAIEYLLLAGDQARSLYANQEAAGLYQQALLYLKEIGDLERTAHTLMKLYLVHHSSFKFDEAQKSLEECTLIWQKLAGQDLKQSLAPAPVPFRLAKQTKTNFDPGLCNDIFNSEYIKELFNGLVEWSEDRAVVPFVSKYWEVLDEGTRYIFHLRDDVFWNDGKPVTALDFEFAWKRTLDPATHALCANLLYDIRGARDYHQGRSENSDGVGVSALDPTILSVELEEPCGYFPYLLGDPTFFPIPKHVVDRVGDKWAEPANIVTNGAFQLDPANKPTANTIYLTKNPHYFGPYKGNIEQVTLTSYLNEVEMYRAFVSGELDLVDFLIPQMRRDELKHYEELGQLHISPIPFVDAVYFVTDRPPFNDKNLRRAFVLATDRERLAREIENQIPATGGYIPPGLPGHSPDNTLPYDPLEARRILAGAGYPQGQGFPSIGLLLGLVGLEKGDNSVFNLLQNMWKENLGITVYEFWDDTAETQFGGRQDYQLFFIGWMADYPDPASFLQTNYLIEKTNWHNLEYDALLEEGRRTIEQGKRVDLYRKADRILIEDSVILPLFYGHIFEVRQPWVHQLGKSLVYNSQWKDTTLLPH